jgi:hydroxymethylpyrimidine/phosphomethylpyrimidine kinase
VREVIAQRRPFVLSIGTTEPWAAAGLQLDAFIADRLSIRILSCVVAVSAQDGKGALSVTPMAGPMVQAQLDSLGEVEIAGVRIGAMRTKTHVDKIAAFLQCRRIPSVLDPVIATSAGGQFLTDDALAHMRSVLFPHIDLLTPNLHEAGMLIDHPVATLGEMDAAALRIADMGPKAVLIKGGHLAGIPIDVLWDGEQLRHLEAPRLPHDMRGTGCVLALTYAAALAYGHSLKQAVMIARDVVRILIQASRSVGHMWIAP